jgi:acetylglutamate kinase
VVTPHRHGNVVVKLGGRALEAPGAPRELAAGVASLSGVPVLVHGGGAEVSAWSARLGVPAAFVGGLRVTDAATLEVATAVLAGLANKRLVAALRATGVDAVGLSALDGGIAEVVPHPDAARLGEVGAIASVRTNLLATLIESGRVPVLASIGARAGRLLNLNADDLASAIAAALGAPVVLMLSDTPGVVLGGDVARRLDVASLDAALEGGEVTGGMVAKLRAARAAVTGGAGRAVIAAWQGPGTLAALLAGEAIGTTIEAGAARVPAATSSLHSAEPVR